MFPAAIWREITSFPSASANSIECQVRWKFSYPKDKYVWLIESKTLPSKDMSSTSRATFARTILLGLSLALGLEENVSQY
jgi:hypothetical protein